MIIPIERLQREAEQAATQYTDINAACPYPFHTDAAHAFTRFFREALSQGPADRAQRGTLIEGGAP